MERKTKVTAEDGRQELTIIREFDLPLELLFTAYTDAEIVEQWMGTKVLKLKSKKHGSYEFETTDPKGNKFRFNGVIHDFIPNRKIIRTFEMESMQNGVQLEIYEFEQITENTSKLSMHVLYETVAQRDRVLSLPFAKGIDMAHNRIQELLSTVNKK